MESHGSFMSIINDIANPKTLWDGRYKIPWDDPEFSRRMLAEHLSQSHDLASRRDDMISRQIDWLHLRVAENLPGRLLDLGCGPGLYIEKLAGLGHRCEGIDFSPASVEHARERLGERASVQLGDVRQVDYGTGFDVVMMLYGELNVFSPRDCRLILGAIHRALKPKGRVALEVHTYEAVRAMGETPNYWYRSGSGLTGLFSNRPHICLVESHWYESERTAQQMFHVLDAESGKVDTYRSTTRAWTDDEYRTLLTEAGFTEVMFHPDWPVPPETHQMVTARRRG